MATSKRNSWIPIYNGFAIIPDLRQTGILGWLGDRTTAPSLLTLALYRCDHQAVGLLGGHIGIMLEPRGRGSIPAVTNINSFETCFYVMF